MVSSRPKVNQYALTVASCFVALALTYYIPALRQNKHTLLFLCAVTFSAWIGGWRTGFVAILLSSVLYAYKILPPYNSVWISDPYDLLRLVLFLVVAILLNSMQAARDRAERMLRSSQLRMDLALDAARMGAWELGVRTGDFWSSHGLCDIYGRRPDKFAYTYESFLGYIFPADRDEVVRAISRVIEAGGSCQVEHRITCGDKSVRQITTRCRAFSDEKGRIDRLMGVTIEVSQAPGIGASTFAEERQHAFAV